MTLLEILISFVIISFGLLGVASLQIMGLKNNHSALYRTNATVLAYDMLDRMRVNRKAMTSGSYDTGNVFKDSTNINGAPVSMVDFDMNDWLTALQKRLPSGKGKIEASSGTATIRVTIQWDDQRGTGGSATQNLSVESQNCEAGSTCNF